MKLLFFPLFIGCLVFFGLGCKKTSSRDQATPPTRQFENPAYLPPAPPPENENAKNLRELREALDNFKQAKTFRAKLSIEGKDGQTTGQIDVMKPERFHGTLQIPKQNGTSEVIGVADTLYVKLPDGSWMVVKTPAVSKALTEAFRSAVDSEGSATKTALPDDAIVTMEKDNARNCDHYIVTLQSQTEPQLTLSVCVQNGLPKVTELKSDAGQAMIEYFDYNKLFVIERPTVSVK